MQIIKFIGIKERSIPRYKKEYIPTEFIDGKTILKPVADVSNVENVSTEKDIHYIPLDKITHLESWKGYRINDIETTKEEFERIIKELENYGK